MALESTAPKSILPSNNRLPMDYLQARWYATYTCARHEKRVAEQLQQRSVECFLPLYEAVRRWKDRRKRVELPLFPGYVFVRIELKDRLQVLSIPGVARLVGFDSHPYPLPEEEMQILRRGLTQELRTEPYPFLTVGQRVRVNSGPLSGLEGILLRRKGNLRVVLSIDLIMRSIAVDVDAADVVPISKPKEHLRG